MRLKYTMKPDEKATFTTAAANDKPVLTFDVVITDPYVEPEIGIEVIKRHKI